MSRQRRRSAAEAGLEPEYDLDSWRCRIPILESKIPLANCSHSPLALPVQAAFDAYRSSWQHEVMDWDAWMEQVDRAKRLFARLIHAEFEEIAIVPSVTAAAAIIASCFDFDDDRNGVVLTEAEFPTVGHVWLGRESQGVRLAWVPVRDGVIRLEDYDDAIDERTRLVCACHGYYVNGYVQDLSAIARKAHANGSLVFVDAYQTLGVYPVDVRASEVDFLTSGAHKYLMGAPGIAFLYVKKELIERLQPKVTGWFGRADIFAFDVRRLDWAPTAARFEIATPPVPSAYLAAAGMEMILDVGVDRIRRWTAKLAGRLLDRAGELGLEVHGTKDIARKTATTAIACPGDSASIEAALRAKGIVAASRAQVVRLAPHFFSSVEDVDTGLDVLAAEIRRQAAG